MLNNKKEKEVKTNKHHDKKARGLFSTLLHSKSRQMRQENQALLRAKNASPYFKAKLRQSMLYTFRDKLKNPDDILLLEVYDKNRLSLVLELLNELSDRYDFMQGIAKAPEDKRDYTIAVKLKTVNLFD